MVETVKEVVTNEIPTAHLEAVNALVLETKGLRARLEGVRRAPATAVFESDTVLEVDTIPVAIRADGMTVSTVYSIRSDSVTRREEGIDLRDCDDGWGFSGGVWTCDPARFGHLTLQGGLEAVMDSVSTFRVGFPLGVEWIPSFRSTWRVNLDYDPLTSRKRLWIRKGVRLF